MANVRPGSDIDELLGWAEVAQSEADRLWQVLYFEARVDDRLDEVLARAPHSRTAALEMTRRENESRGRHVRWGRR